MTRLFMEKGTILILTGTIDFQTKGIQTLKQTVKYFSKKYRVRMLSFLPSTWPDIDKDFEKTLKDLKVDRLPGWINFLFLFYVRMQEKIFKARQKAVLQGDLKISAPSEFFGYNSKIGLILPNLAALAYLLLEFPRAFYFVLKERPLFIYGYEKEGALLGSLLGKLMKIPVIKRFQGTQLSLKNGQILHRPFFISLILAHKIFRYPVVMANDGTFGDEVLKHLGIPQNRFLFLMNGFVTEHLTHIKPIDLRRVLGLPDKAGVILMLSRLWTWKRVDRGIILFKTLLQQKREEEDYFLVIIGEGNARDSLQALSERLGVGHRVKFLGDMPHPQALEFLKACDVFWSFYDISNLGNPLLESIYLGKPLITIRNKYIESLLGKDAPNLVDIGDLEKAVELTLRVLRDENFKRSLVERALGARKFLISWEERMEKEIAWIEGKIREER